MDDTSSSNNGRGNGRSNGNADGDREEEGEWVAAQAEQREPVTANYPAERIERVNEE